jgi:hypothetical protein
VVKHLPSSTVPRTAEKRSEKWRMIAANLTSDQSQGTGSNDKNGEDIRHERPSVKSASRS